MLIQMQKFKNISSEYIYSNISEKKLIFGFVIVLFSANFMKKFIQKFKKKYVEFMIVGCVHANIRF